MKSHDDLPGSVDPLARLAADADRLVDALSAVERPAAVVEMAAALKQGIGRVSAALRHRRGEDLRASLDGVERRNRDEELAAEKAHAEERVASLEAEVEALLSSPDAARKLYESRTGGLADRLASARIQRERADAKLLASSTASEMERSRDALAARAAREREDELEAERQALKTKLARLKSG